MTERLQVQDRTEDPVAEGSPVENVVEQQTIPQPAADEPAGVAAEGGAASSSPVDLDEAEQQVADWRREDEALLGEALSSSRHLPKGRRPRRRRLPRMSWRLPGRRSRRCWARAWRQRRSRPRMSRRCRDRSGAWLTSTLAAANVPITMPLRTGGGGWGHEFMQNDAHFASECIKVGAGAGMRRWDGRGSGCRTVRDEARVPA